MDLWSTSSISSSSTFSSSDSEGFREFPSEVDGALLLDVEGFERGTLPFLGIKGGGGEGNSSEDSCCRCLTFLLMLRVGDGVAFKEDAESGNWSGLGARLLDVDGRDTFGILIFSSESTDDTE